MQHCLAVHFDRLKVWKASAPKILTSPSLKYAGFLIPKEVQAIGTQFPKQTKIKKCSWFQLFVYISRGFLQCQLCKSQVFRQKFNC